MKNVVVVTGNVLKFHEIQAMLSLYGVQATQAHASDELPTTPFDAICEERSELVDIGDGLHEHRSTLRVQYVPEGHVALSGFDDTLPSELFEEHVRGVLRVKGFSADESCYHWDYQFYPLGSSKSLHELKQMGMKVSARQLAVGRWLGRWLTYDEPVRWRHMESVDTPGQWIVMHPILLSPPCAPTRAIIERVDAMGAWFKRSWNRRAKHYWWPGLNAGIPQVPKKDYIHELTFLVHDLIHWSMPDAFLDGQSAALKKLYILTRMMSEAVTLSMADMAFIDQAIQAGLEYDTSKRKIHPVYDAKYPIRDWCKAMSVYAILGQSDLLEDMAKSPQALEAFKQKYGVFFEEDLRWTNHNAQALQQHYSSSWMQRCKSVAQAHPQLGFSFASDYLCMLEGEGGDRGLVERVFDMFWNKHFGESAHVRGERPEDAAKHRLIRKWLGQSALCDKMQDLPLSILVAGHLEQTMIQGDLQALESVEALWLNYVSSLEGMHRLSANDAELFKQYYPVVSPMYVSYDQDASTYQGIDAIWQLISTQ